LCVSEIQIQQAPPTTQKAFVVNDNAMQTPTICRMIAARVLAGTNA